MPEKHYDLGMTYYRDRDDRLSMTRVTKRECNTKKMVPFRQYPEPGKYVSFGRYN